MSMNLEKLIDLDKAYLDSNGIWVSKMQLSHDQELSKKSWEKIYKYDLAELKKVKQSFDKLGDHLKYILDDYEFTKETVYLEIGCGPAHVGSYLMEKYGCNFIGVDFNYDALVVLKEFFLEKGLTNFVLIHGDIKDMPIKENTIDYIYGGGVIEHTDDTLSVLRELYRVLKTGGVSFNTVPGFNFFWLTRFYMSIPAVPLLRNIFSFLHFTVFRGKILNKFYGFELSFTQGIIGLLHREAGFKQIKTKPFPFHPSKDKLFNQTLRDIYFNVSSSRFFCLLYYVRAVK